MLCTTIIQLMHKARNSEQELEMVQRIKKMKINLFVLYRMMMIIIIICRFIINFVVVKLFFMEYSLHKILFLL